MLKLNPVTCKASDVLKHGSGYCYAKSHLLAALFRANKIPAGFCLPIEKFAFPIITQGEADLPEISVEPLSVVITVLKQSKTDQEVADILPDIELITANT